MLPSNKFQQLTSTLVGGRSLQRKPSDTTPARLVVLRGLRHFLLPGFLQRLNRIADQLRVLILLPAHPCLNQNRLSLGKIRAILPRIAGKTRPRWSQTYLPEAEIPWWIAFRHLHLHAANDSNHRHTVSILVLGCVRIIHQIADADRVSASRTAPKKLPWDGRTGTSL